MDNKFYLEAEIVVDEATKERKEKASKVIKLPDEKSKQPDLLYFSAIFVSTGTNLNGAHFLGSELLSSEGTIVNKALDIEHSEDEIIGHIYDKAFITKDGDLVSLEELSSKEVADQDSQDLHVVIAGIIYKARFPEIAQEVSDGKWKVSMECYYKDYDLKIGSLILDEKEALLLGLDFASDSYINKPAKVIKDGKEIANDKIVRVLREILFSGCGIVEKPANPPSLVLETAKEKKDRAVDTSGVIVLNYDNVDQDSDDIGNNNVTSDKIDKDKSALDYKDTVGLCVSYKKRVLNKENELVHENWCSLFSKDCTSFSRTVKDPECLLVKHAKEEAKSVFDCLNEKRIQDDKRKELLERLKAALSEAVKN